MSRAGDGWNDIVEVQDVHISARTRGQRPGLLRRAARWMTGRRSAERDHAPSGSELVVARADRFDEFYRINYAPVVRLAMSLCGSADESEELAARAFLAAHRRWRRIVAHDRPDQWVRRVVVNRAVTHGDPDDDLVLPPAPPSARSLQFEPTDPDLWAALRDLAPRHAQVIALAYVDDQPTPEIAAILGLDEQRVRALLDTARVRLARLLALHDRDGHRP